ncbi:MAG: O-antigen ligase family protein [Cytophagales bacterium]|nr:O-antigen ligase family protein [Cytophagales bacterium]MCA6428755.1 O-antigen ligase family protein [Cytophagales bacterium]
MIILSNRSVIQRLKTYLFLLFCFSIPISQLASSRLLILLAIVSLFVGHRPFQWKVFIQQWWDIAIYFLVLVAGVAYSQNTELAFRQLETSLCLLALPLVVYRLGPLHKKNLTQLFEAFVAGLAVACAICLGVAVYQYSLSRQPSVDFFLFENLTKTIDAQPTYFGYYLVFGITFALYKFYFETHRRYLLIPMAVVVFFFFVLLLTGSQTVFISLLFVFSFFISKYLIQRTSKRETLAVIFVVAAIAILGTWATWAPLQEGRDTHTDYWERFDLWEAAMNASSNKWMGVGTGDYEEALNQYYRSHQMEHFADSNLNAHNQYVQMMLSNGMIGLIAFLLMMVRPLYLATGAKDLLGLLLLYPFVLYGITEVFLGRYQGVVFFGFVHQILIAYYATLPSAESAKLDNLRRPNASVNI